MSIRSKTAEASDIISETVEVPEWGVTLEVRTIAANVRAKFVSQMYDEKGQLDFDKLYPSLLIASCFDPENGEPAYLPEDETMLGTKSGAVVERIALVAMKLAGLTKEAESEMGKDSSLSLNDATTSS